MTTAAFDPTGGPILAGISCAPSRDGSYSLTLWEATENSVVNRFKGNFINPDDDTYELPGSPTEHQGRLLEALVVVAVPHGVGPSTISLKVVQDGAELAEASAFIAPGTAGGVADLFVTLEAST